MAGWWQGSTKGIRTCSKGILFFTNDIYFYLLSHIQYNILVAQFREQIVIVSKLYLKLLRKYLCWGSLSSERVFTKYKFVCMYDNRHQTIFMYVALERKLFDVGYFNRICNSHFNQISTTIILLTQLTNISTRAIKVRKMVFLNLFFGSKNIQV